MRSAASSRAINTTNAAMLIVLFAICSFAQEASQQSKATTLCERNFRDPSSGTVDERPISEPVRAKVFSVAPSRGKPKCNFFLVSSSVMPLDKDKSGRVRNWKAVNFELSRVTTGSSSTTRTVPGKSAQAVQDSASETQELAKKLNNPVASLISLPLQSNFDFGMGTGSGWRYTLNVQPVIPIALSPKWNLISRTILPIIHQGNVTGPNTSQSGLGDTVQSFFLSPNKSEPFIWAVGPVVLLPTATDASLGAQKWGLGPTAALLKQSGGWTVGILANHIWSVAGKANRADVNATFVQPVLSYTTKQAWTYAINTESTYDWNARSWSIPINPTISKLVRFGKQPMSFGGGLKCWATTPTGGPEGCGLRITVTALFPKK